MSSKSKKLNSSEIAAFEAKRDIGAEILQSLKDMKAGKGKVGIHKRHPVQMRMLKIDRQRVAGCEVGIGQIRTTQNGAFKFGIAQLGSSKFSLTEVTAAQILPPEVAAIEIAALSNKPL